MTPRKKHRRKRRSKLLPTPPKKGSVKFPGAQGGDSVEGWTPSHFADWVVKSPEYDETVGVLCQERWDALSDHAKDRRAWTPRMLDSIELLRRALGLRTASAIRDFMAGDRGGGARRRLGFDNPTDHVHNRQRPKQQREEEDPLRDGVPSEGAMSRHKTEMAGEDEDEHGEVIDARVAAWEACAERVIINNIAEFPILQVDVRTTFGDGTGAPTVCTAPIYEKKAKKHRDGTPRAIVNADKITAPQAGYVPYSAGRDKEGHGWNIFNLSGVLGLPYCWTVIRRHDSEAAAALHLFKTQYQRIILPFVRGQICVFSADGALHSQPLRGFLRSLNIVENIHLASHYPGQRSSRQVRKMNKATYGIHGHPHWCVNGHRELRARCAPDYQNISHGYRMDNDHLRVYVQGECKCGHPDNRVTITSGRWRMNSQNTAFVKCANGEEPDWEMGNPLTYYSHLAKLYGTARWSYQEGMHGLLSTTYALLDKRAWRCTDEVRLEAAMVFCIMHIVAREALRQQGLSSTHEPSARPDVTMANTPAAALAAAAIPRTLAALKAAGK